MRAYRLLRAVSIASTVLIVLASAFPAAAVEVGTEFVQSLGGSGRLVLATSPGPYQVGVELLANHDDAGFRLDGDVWVRRYSGAKWVGVAVGHRAGGQSVAMVLAGYRLSIGGEAFLDPAVGIQWRSDGRVYFVPKVYASVAF